ncbi:DUF6286 domain-containing protein [Corynebacterium sp. SA-MJD20WY100]|uniref:DUF6286 domain-containing protein n=1 Tax=Corynebacterium sp. SA-MJD20WY100 TaxID=3142969 RepID=UPI003221B772
MSTDAAVPSRGQEPKGAPIVRWWALLLSLALLALAAVFGREAWRVSTHATVDSWTQPFIDVMSGDAQGSAAIAPWMLWGGAAGIVVGLLMLYAALRPRRRTHVELASGAISGWTRQVDIARRCSATARKVPGVGAARTTAGKKGIHLIINGDIEDENLATRVREVVNEELASLAHPAPLSVTVERIEEVDTNV